MNTQPQNTRLQDSATTLVEESIGPRAARLVQIFLDQRQCERRVTSALIDAAKGLGGEQWAERVFAVLLLENQVLLLFGNQLDEIDFILVQLGLKPRPGIEVPLRASLLNEGYSTTNFREFAPEFCRRLSRLNRVHQHLQASDWNEGAWRRMIRASCEVCKLTLTRYVFSAPEIAEEIRKSVTCTQGTEHTLSRVHGVPGYGYLREAMDLIPELEGALLEQLCARQEIYWVCEKTSQDLNSLVEYPLTSAVLTIKPPGSDLEFELKRAGTRGSRHLNVICEQDGKYSPVSHRLYGGSMGWLGRREAAAVATFSKIYRLIHGKECPFSRTVAISSVAKVPGNDGEQHILDYLTEQEAFGEDGFEDMRRAMQACVESFPADTGVMQAQYPGTTGLTLQFIGQAQPQQAMIVDSSSFRLDRILLYLSESGPEQYFRNGLRRDYDLGDACWLADTVLEEILGCLVAPVKQFTDYLQYVRNCFDVPENRIRADAAYFSVVNQLGECWGTLLALHGYSDGESFVLRNVGLKSAWKAGDWHIRIIFMDNDDLAVSGMRLPRLEPARAVPGMLRDQVHILGGPLSGDTIPGELGTLRKIYRVDHETSETGLRALQEAIGASYGKTRAALAANQELRELFFPSVLSRLLDWDELVSTFLMAHPTQESTWIAEAAAYLQARDYSEAQIGEYTRVIPQFRRFFDRLRFLYSSK